MPKEVQKKVVETKCTKAKQKVEELLHQIDFSKQYLDEYRSHLACLKIEAKLMESK
jgi:hypothetical protein